MTIYPSVSVTETAISRVAIKKMMNKRRRRKRGDAKNASCDGVISIKIYLEPTFNNTIANPINIGL
jgi:hypothetical protein